MSESLNEKEVSGMGEKRQRYNEEFKRETIKYIQEQTKSVGEIAEELNMPAGTIHQWLAHDRKIESGTLTNSEKVHQLELDLKDKEREIADLREEIAILKKAQHIFSQE